MTIISTTQSRYNLQSLNTNKTQMLDSEINFWISVFAEDKSYFLGTTYATGIPNFLNRIRSKNFRLVNSIPVTYTKEIDNSFVVSDDKFLVYGVGDSLHDAIYDYENSLIEFYEILEEGAESNNFDQIQLGQLQNYIIRK